MDRWALLSMEYVYAALLLHRAGKPVDEDGIKKVVEAAGVQVDEVKVKALVAALKEVNIDEVIKSAALAPTAPSAPSAPAAAPAEKKEEKAEKEEKKEEKKEEETALEGLAALFG